MYNIKFADDLCNNPLPQHQHADFLAWLSVEIGTNPYAATTNLRNMLGYSVVFLAKKYHIVFRIENATVLIVMMSLNPSIFNQALAPQSI